jgi:hypothetical protein
VDWDGVGLRGAVRFNLHAGILPCPLGHLQSGHRFRAVLEAIERLPANGPWTSTVERRCRVCRRWRLRSRSGWAA